MTTIAEAGHLRTATRRIRPLESEDWLAVFIGFVSLVGVVAGIRPDLPVLAWSAAADLPARVLSAPNLIYVLTLGVLLALLSTTRVLLMSGSVPRFLLGFPVLYFLSLAAQFLAGNTVVASWGLEYVIFAFAIGLLVSNTVGVPAWLKEAAQTEFYIKTGLVILGASILFNDLIQAGFLGIAQALLVVTDRKSVV